jgi:large subunit ribosomal protein L5
MAKTNTSKVAGYIPNLKNKYTTEIVAQLSSEFGYKSAMEVPELEKIVLNQGLGDAVADKKLIDVAVAELSSITGQKAVVTYAKKDISNFKLRKGMPIGAKVTLRGNTMYEFLDKLISIALPRIRDFKGVNDKLDGRGNYALGIKEQIIFPEIDIEKVTKIMGLEINFVTTAKTDKEAFALLKAFGIPFKNE